MLIKQKVKKYTSIITLTIGMTSLWSCDYDKLDKWVLKPPMLW
ncbi:hypothetical protein Q2T41_19660 [Maribacter confluentis]|uniref:Uncharacterized protein n=1 Tax=Maribacter confluentis TaxID=1656093 RepID=A0ABT8RVL1_9FLAO|nr:hypothetical protein [Maribacter confluentis]MDO1514845.1 hypothetical protein [Maribacter confluentis]